MTITNPREFTTFEVAKVCGMYPTTVINWVNKGRLKARTTPGGHRRIAVGDLVDFMQRFDMPIPANLVARPKRILIVEDDLSVQRMLTRALESLPGVVIATCLGGLEALMAIGKEAPDLLLLDIRIPQVNGIEVCRVLKASELTNPIKIIVISGEVLDPSVREFLAAHADGFFHKPLPTGELKELAAGLLELDATGAGATF